MEGRGLEEEDEERSGEWRREKEEGERVEEGVGGRDGGVGRTREAEGGSRGEGGKGREEEEEEERGREAVGKRRRWSDGGCGREQEEAKGG